jgi:type VI secretion system protein ImpH
VKALGNVGARDWSFFALVRRLVGSGGAVSPGGAGPARGENLRFRPAATLGFAPADVDEVEAAPAADAPGEQRYLVTVNFMGLYGPASPLPNHFTEEVLWAGVDGQGMRDFLDLFHHRFISFVYRAWEKYRYPVQCDPERPDEFTLRVLCLMGLGTRGTVEAAGIERRDLLRATGLLADRHRSAAGLEAFLSTELEGIGVRVISCVERRVGIPPAQLALLGRRNSRLGEELCLGERLSDRSSAFRIVVGSLDEAGFRRLLPGGKDLARLVRLARLYVSDPLQFDLTLRLRADQVPALRLGEETRLPLGQMSWLVPTGREEGRATLAMGSMDPLRRPRPARAASAAPAGPPAAASEPRTPTARAQPRPIVIRRT